jgi:CheY-like chemotaxis protein
LPSGTNPAACANDVHALALLPFLSDASVVTNKRRFVRVAGPFNGWRIGMASRPLRIYDLSDGGCFVETLESAPEPGRPLVMKIDVPGEGAIYLKGETVYVKPDVGFAVSFIDVPADAFDRLRRGLLRLRGVVSEAEQDQAIRLPLCPRCRGAAVRPLGMASSTLPWFTCETCEHVWAARDQAPAPEAVVDDTSVPARSSREGAKHILIADDDGGVLNVLTKGLAGYRILAARDVAEAWTLGRNVPLDLLITDYLMPDGTGEELITKLRQSQPTLKVLILTGHERLLEEEGFGWWNTERHLTKPCSLAAIRTAVAELIGPAEPSE